MPKMWEGGELGMKAAVPRVCVTCKHYVPDYYYCAVDNHYIGYLNCQELNKCKAYRLHEDYKRGGRLYDDRQDKK